MNKEEIAIYKNDFVKEIWQNSKRFSNSNDDVPRYVEVNKIFEIVEKYKDKEIDRLKDLCNKYEEEHNTAFKLWTQKMEEMPDYEERMKLKKEVDRLKLHIIAIKEAISTWNLEYEEGYNEFKIPKKIMDVVWGDKE